MLFNNKITTDKNQEKLYKKGKSIIDEKASGIERMSNFEESLDMRRHQLINRPTGNASIKREVFKRRSNCIKTVTEKLFKESVFEIFYESLMIDESFKFANKANLFNLFDETFNNLLESNNTNWEAIKKDSSTFTENLFAICEEVAKEKAEKNITFDSVKKDKVSDEALLNEKNKKKEDETATTEDKKKVDKETDSDKKDVTEVIKDKVASTIKDEKEKSEKEEEANEDIKEKSKTDKEKEEEEAKEDDTTTDDSDSESDVDENSSDEDKDTEEDDAKSTEEDDASSSEDNNEDSDSDDDKDSDEKDKDSDSDDDKDSDEKDKDKDSDSDGETKSESYYFRRRLTKPNKMRNTSLFRSIEINVANKFLKEKSEGLIEEGIEMNLDLIFAESLSYYTLLETFNTIGIIKLRPSQLKSLCKELILK